MKIRTKIAIQFSVIVSIILLVFSGSIYFFTENSRQERFYLRIFLHANTTARLMSDVDEIDNKLLTLIDKTSASRLPEEGIQVYNLKDSLLYTNHKPIVYSKSFWMKSSKKKKLESKKAKKN